MGSASREWGLLVDRTAPDSMATGGHDPGYGAGLACMGGSVPKLVSLHALVDRSLVLAESKAPTAAHPVCWTMPIGLIKTQGTHVMMHVQWQTLPRVQLWWRPGSRRAQQWQRRKTF